MSQPTPAFVCRSRGTTPVDAMASELDEAKVQFALMRFPTGSGTFSRNKFVYLHFTGPHCPPLRRAKWNNLRGDALQLFATSTGIDATASEEVTFENIAARVKSVFVSDNGGAFSIQGAKGEYTKRIEEEARKAAEEKQRREAMRADAPAVEKPAKNRPLAVALGLNEASVLKAIHEEFGPLNWALFTSSPQGTPALVEAGSGGLPELFEHLPEDKVLFGITRVSFGTGRFRRSKRIYIQWIGEHVGVVTKGKAAAVSSSMLKAVGPANADIRLHETPTTESFIRMVEPFFVVDNIKSEGSGKAARLSQEDYIAALLEEQKKAKAFFNEPESGTQTPTPSPEDGTYDAAQSVAMVHDGSLAWCILEPRQ